MLIFSKGFRCQPRIPLSALSQQLQAFLTQQLPTLAELAVDTHGLPLKQDEGLERTCQPPLPLNLTDSLGPLQDML